MSTNWNEIAAEERKVTIAEIEIAARRYETWPGPVLKEELRACFKRRAEGLHAAAKALSELP